MSEFTYGILVKGAELAVISTDEDQRNIELTGRIPLDGGVASKFKIEGKSTNSRLHPVHNEQLRLKSEQKRQACFIMCIIG